MYMLNGFKKHGGDAALTSTGLGEVGGAHASERVKESAALSLGEAYGGEIVECVVLVCPQRLIHTYSLQSTAGRNCRPCC